MASVEFRSRARMAVLYRGVDATGGRVYSRFSEHRLVTADPEEVAFVLGLCAKQPGDYEVVGGAAVCTVCFKVCASEFALEGHKRSHEPKADEAEVEKEES